MDMILLITGSILLLLLILSFLYKVRVKWIKYLFQILLLFLILHNAVALNNSQKLQLAIYCGTKIVHEIGNKIDDGVFQIEIEDIDPKIWYEPIVKSYPRFMQIDKSHLKVLVNHHNSNYRYIVYYFGSDGDDDERYTTYNINSLFFGSPFKNGDIILYDFSYDDIDKSQSLWYSIL